MTTDLHGWVILPAAEVPERWRSRAISVAMVPLMPSEARSVLAVGSSAPALDGDMALMSLVADGYTREAMARQLGISVRTVQRRLAHLQTQTGCPSLQDLALLFARAGFGGARGVPVTEELSLNGPSAVAGQPN